MRKGKKKEKNIKNNKKTIQDDKNRKKGKTVKTNKKQHKEQ